MKHSILSASVATALALGACSAAFAQSTTVNLGLAYIEPNSTATAMSGPFTPVNALSLKVKNQGTVFFSVARDITANLEVELALGIPPTHDVSVVVLNPAAVPGSVAAQNGAIGAKVRQVAPTLFVNYKFGDSSSALRPFVGLGGNYTKFDKADSTAVNDAINGGATTLKLTDSHGLAAQLGGTFKLNDGWSVTGAVSTAQVKTHLTSNTLGIVRTSDIKFSPTALTLTAGYSF